MPNIDLDVKELEKVNGGSSVIYNGVMYSDGDAFCDKCEDFTLNEFSIYVISNCALTTCDINVYRYNKETKIATYQYPYNSGVSYGFLNNLKKANIEILQYN